jgi:cell wall-associated NlpC family hydrolase
MTGARLAQAAQALVGVPFRLHGRDRETGLDCIGVLACALEAIGRPANLPAAYSVRTRVIANLDAIVSSCGFMVTNGAALPGDVILARVGPLQVHLLIATGANSFVHAHARLGRVLNSPMPDTWKIVGHWRLDPNCEAR